MDETKKKNKVANLIGELSRNQIILNKGTLASPQWKLIN
jgi:hypothetical protein